MTMREFQLEKLLEEKMQELAAMDSALTQIQQKLSTAQLKLQMAQQQNNLSAQNLQLMQNSISWRLTKPLRIVKQLFARQKNKSSATENKNKYQSELMAIMQQYSERQIIVFKPFIDWSVPLFQRPHHLAKYLAAEGFLYFFCTPNAVHDNINGFLKIGDGVFVTNQYELLLSLQKQKILHFYSTDYQKNLSLINERLAVGDKILYEFVDEHHADLAQIELTATDYEQHESLLKNEQVFCIATANKLFDQVKAHRQKNIALVSNGVELDHFSIKNSRQHCPEAMVPIVKSGKPIIGYYGALAKWFDYRLVLKLAVSRPDYHIVLIGAIYDAAFYHYDWQKYSNITILEPVDYKILPQYAQWFSVAMIPFLQNNITEATSPIKLFEYMALEKPIVTTYMPECRKYTEILTAENHEDFISYIDKALTLQHDKNYLSQLRQIALANTWQKKASEIAKLIRTNLRDG